MNPNVMKLIAGGKGYLCRCRSADRLPNHEAQEEVKRILCALVPITEMFA